jgi:hypothetical protein
MLRERTNSILLELRKRRRILIILRILIIQRYVPSRRERSEDHEYRKGE